MMSSAIKVLGLLVSDKKNFKVFPLSVYLKLVTSWVGPI